MALRTRCAAGALALLAGCAAGSGAPPVGHPANPAAPAHGLAAAIARADSLIESGIGVLTPGAVLLVSIDGRVVHQRAYGFAQTHEVDGRLLSAPRPMRLETIFDLASVTKVAATTMAVMLLVDRAQVQLDAPLHRYLSELRGTALEPITPRHLLTHTSGLLQWQPLYYGAASPEETFRQIRGMPLGWEVGSDRRYSDLGFMLLGYLVERVSGEPLDLYVERELYRPLGLRRTAFNPLLRGHSNFAATETGNAYEQRMVHDTAFGYRYPGDPHSWNGWRHQVLLGEVNDGNAWYANRGVAGHAGLFSTAAELRVLVDLLLAGGVHEGRRYLRHETIAHFLTPDPSGNLLGWARPAWLPAGSFSHTGFTGTFVAGIPEHRLSVVLLTNRQHLGADGRGHFPDVAQLQRTVTESILFGISAAR